MSAPRHSLQQTLFRLGLIGVVAVGLTACETLDRLGDVGGPPKMSKIENPVQSANYSPISMPMPQPKAPQAGMNSLWRPGSRAFFKDQRASEIGDILTVNVNFDTQETQFQTRTDTSRNNNEVSNSNLTAFGFESKLNKILPSAANPAQLFNMGETNKVYGDGTTYRKDKFTAVIAATITQVLPNGNLVIMGRQELRVNDELRELTIQGVIRPQDIDSTNSITYDKVAEARVALGGRGNLSDVTRARWGQEVFDLVFPF